MAVIVRARCHTVCAAVHITQWASCACSIPRQVDLSTNPRHCNFEIVKSGEFATSQTFKIANFRECEIWRLRSLEITKSADCEISGSGHSEIWRLNLERHLEIRPLDHKQKKERKQSFSYDKLSVSAYVHVHPLACSKKKVCTNVPFNVQAKLLGTYAHTRSFHFVDLISVVVIIV